MTVAWMVAGGLALLLGGGAGGFVLAGRSSAVLEAQAQIASAQAEQLEALAAGQQALVEQVSKPLVLDAELRSTLAKTPPACVAALGGDALSPQCLLMACWQYGQSAAQRPDCDAVEALAVSALTPSRVAP